MQLCREKLGIDLPKDAISRSHRVGRQRELEPGELAHQRPIIVRFNNYRTRQSVFNLKKKLKGTSITIREDLTHRRLELYRKVATKYGAKNVWTLDGRVLWVKNGKKNVATRIEDLPAEVRIPTTTSSPR